MRHICAGEQKRRQLLPRALVFLEGWIACPISQVYVDLQGQSQQGELGFHPHPIGAGEIPTGLG